MYYNNIEYYVSYAGTSKEYFLNVPSLQINHKKIIATDGKAAIDQAISEIKTKLKPT